MRPARALPLNSGLFLFAAVLLLAAGPPASSAAERGPRAENHCDASGSILVPQPSKATSATVWTSHGGGILRGYIDYQTECAHPDASFGLTYTSAKPVLAADCSLYDFDVLFFLESNDPEGSVGEYRECGDETGRVPTEADFAVIILVSGVPGATFSYNES